MALVIIDFTFVAYLIPGMFGAPLKALAGYLPPIESQDFVVWNTRSGSMPSAGPVSQINENKYGLEMPLGLSGYFNLDEGLAAAKETGKPVFVDITGHGCVNCREMEQRFEIYRNCLGRSQIDTIVTHYLASLDALPISIYGKLYFVPRHQMHKVDLFEDFLEALNEANRSDKPLVVNSFYVADDDKQREKMTAEFYALVRREAQEYEERAAHLMGNGTQSPAILERWVKRIRELEEKRQRFEELFRRQLDETDSEFDTLRLYSQELQVRARGLRTKKIA